MKSPEIKDFQAKYYAAMRIAIEQDVTFLGHAQSEHDTSARRNRRSLSR
jgi:hypothetical protein